MDVVTLAAAKKYADSIKPTQEEIGNAVEDYLEENPIEPYDDTELREEVENMQLGIVDGKLTLVRGD